LVEARKLTYDEAEKTGLPTKPNLDLACEVGKRLAKELNADADVVEAGTLLMDCLIGQASQAGKLEKHIEMSLAKTNEILDRCSIPDEEKENIRHCVLEHHGVDRFYSLESEICCNADCYRFASIKGFALAMRYLREMSFSDLIDLIGKKVDEKWGLVSLDVCKRELTEQHSIVEKFLEKLKD